MMPSEPRQSFIKSMTKLIGDTEQPTAILLIKTSAEVCHEVAAAISISCGGKLSSAVEAPLDHSSTTVLQVAHINTQLAEQVSDPEQYARLLIRSDPGCNLGFMLKVAGGNYEPYPVVG
jgi:hypothetical protein